MPWMREPSSSKSRSEVDQRCRRERFLSSIYGGHGIEPIIEPLELAFGNVIHHSIGMNYRDAELAGHVARNLMLDYIERYLIQDPVKLEYPILAEALVFGFLHHVWPGMMEEYDVEAVEMKASYVDPKTGVRWRTRPDLLLRRKHDGSLWYWELKTHGVDPSSFTKMWARKAQLHLGALALEQEHGLQVEGIIVQGFHKGNKYKGSLRSRLVGGYRRVAPPSVGRTTYRLDHAKGFEWFLANEYPDGVQGWVAQIPRETVAETFPVTPPIAPNWKWVAEFLESQGAREVEIARAVDSIDQATSMEELDKILNVSFPKNTEACEDPVRHTRCQYYDACWNPVVSRDPIASGLYKLRVYKDGVEVA